MKTALCQHRRWRKKAPSIRAAQGLGQRGLGEKTAKMHRTRGNCHKVFIAASSAVISLPITLSRIRAMPALASSSADFTAVLFGLSGCLVDFGARTLPVSLQRLYPEGSHSPHPQLPPRAALNAALGREAEAADLSSLQHALRECANEHAFVTPGALHVLETLQQQGVPCAWLDELPDETNQRLASALPAWLPGSDTRAARPWPAPDACWQS